MNAGNQKTVLIAEDESDLGLLLMYHLQRMEFRTLSAAEGRSALKFAFEGQPDLILLDLMLPNLHGFEICRIVKQSPLTCHIPIVIFSAFTASENREKGLALGAIDFFPKQGRMVDVLKRIHQILSPRSSSQK